MILFLSSFIAAQAQAPDIIMHTFALISWKVSARKGRKAKEANVRLCSRVCERHVGGWGKILVKFLFVVSVHLRVFLYVHVWLVANTIGSSERHTHYREHIQHSKYRELKQSKKRGNSTFCCMYQERAMRLHFFSACRTAEGCIFYGLIRLQLTIRCGCVFVIAQVAVQALTVTLAV